MITQARLRLVPRLRDEVHALARRAVREVPGLVSAEFFTQAGLGILVAHAGPGSWAGRPHPRTGRHEDAVFSLVASLGGSISAEHGIGALKTPWLRLARTEAELALFGRIRSALDPAGTLNPNVLPRGPVTILSEGVLDRGAGDTPGAPAHVPTPGGPGPYHGNGALPLS